MKILIILLFISTCATHAADSVQLFRTILDDWNEWKVHFNKSYRDKDEQLKRFQIFLDNKKFIDLNNYLYRKGYSTFTMAMNKFGDLTTDEFARKVNGFNRTRRSNKSALDDPTEVPEGAIFLQPENVLLPDEVDWRKKGWVTPIKNQGDCGSCWAFSATGSLEGQHSRKSGKLVSLSEQNLIDCSGKFGNQGCDGGLMDYAFKYVKYNQGIDTEKSYPYEAEDDRCRYQPKNKGADDAGLVDVKPAGDEDALQAAVATVGPISVAIDASQLSFQFYDNGVYYEPACSSSELDHGVLAVGYGVDQKSKRAYWLVKNSWGTDWGDEGYIKMSRNRHNNCGIATAASYPLVK